VAAVKPLAVEYFARSQAPKKDGRADELATNRGAMAEKQLADGAKALAAETDPVRRATLGEELRKFSEQKGTLDRANTAFKGDKSAYQAGKLGVDLACASNQLRCQDRLTLTANRTACGRNCLEVGGVWIDDTFKAEMKSVVVKAQGEAYFRILEKQPTMKDVYRLGNHLVWVTPSGTALVIDRENGADTLADADIDALFAAKK
jgi:Ca-activated chloride channel family protein